MKINQITKDEFLNFVYEDSDLFLEKIRTPEIFIVKNFYSTEKCQNLRKITYEWGQKTPSSWHPFIDDCPDYHREHDNYPKAYVKQKFHGFYRHNYYIENNEVFQMFKEIFDVKNFLAGFKLNQFIDNIPSEGILPRVNVHHYPKGGGYQAEHIDPDGPFAQIQTLVIASTFGVDFKVGGVYARKELNSKKYYVDS